MAVGMQAIFQRVRGAQCHQPHGDPVDQKVKKNADGSVDIYLSPTAPKGREKNWIQTVPGRAWYVYLRLYGPLEPYYDRSWALPDIEKVN